MRLGPWLLTLCIVGAGCHLVFPYSPGPTDGPRADTARTDTARMDGTDANRWDAPRLDSPPATIDRGHERAPAEAGPKKLEVVATDDAWVDQACVACTRSMMLYADQLWIGNKSQKKYTFLKFDLSGVPTTASISAAILKLCVEGVGSLGAVMTAEIALVAADWNEATLTWGNKPEIAVTPAAVPAFINKGTEAKLDDQSPALINVTSLVQPRLGYGFRLIPGSSTPQDLEVTLYAAEHGGPPTTTSTACTAQGFYKPTLVVTYTP